MDWALIRMRQKDLHSMAAWSVFTCKDSSLLDKLLPCI